MTKAEAIQEIKKIGLYDFVCQCSCFLDRDMLKDIITECVVVATDRDYIQKAEDMKYNYNKLNEFFNNKVIESLKEERDWEDEEEETDED